jgi:putative flavoprotein involved in K+ transport
MKHIETVIVGAGQAGLITSYYLTQHRHEHVVLEQSAKAAFNWRKRCWDSLRLVTPNWAFHRIPGVNHNHAEREDFLSREKVIEFFDNYIKEFQLPVKYNSKVMSIEPDGQDGYLIETYKDNWITKNVIVATGFCQLPKIPAFAKHISSDVLRWHSSEYRNPGLVPAGAILVVGSGHSGCQITEELIGAGRKVFQSIGSTGRLPRRYRGKDIIEWWEMLGLLDLSAGQLPPGMGRFDAIPQFSTSKDGNSINLHLLARNGATLLGHVMNASDNKIAFVPNLYENLEKADQFERDATAMVDGFIQANGLDAPAEELPQYKDGFKQPIIYELDLKKEGINTIIWATGYRFDYSLVKLPVFDKDRFPMQTNGATIYQGLYFAGLPWMPSQKSGFLVGVAESAKQIANAVLETYSLRS